MSKQYSVTQLVKNTKADKLEVQRILLNATHRMSVKDARELLARRRFIARIKTAKAEAKDGCSVYVKDANGMWNLYAICETPADAVEAARYLRDSKQMETVTR